MVQYEKNRVGKRAPPPNYMSRGVQLKLLMLVSMFMIIIVLMIEAGKPENWYWMWGGKPLMGDDPPLAAAERPNKEVDTRVRRKTDTDDLDIPGAIRVQAPKEERLKLPSDDSAAGYFPGVRPELLESIRNDTTASRAVEKDAWFHLLEILDKTEQARLIQASIGRVGFIQLFEQPHTYRGELVTIRGTVRRAHRIMAPRNDYGIEGYFLCWLQPVGGPNSPIVVYSLDMPEGFPTGMELNEQAEVTGFFYKRMAYQAQDGTRAAPCVLAKTARWQPPVKKHRSRLTEWVEAGTVASVVLLTCIVLGVAALAVLVAVFVYVGTRRASGAHSYSVQSRAKPEKLASLKDADLSPGTAEILRQMADDQSPHDEPRET